MSVADLPPVESFTDEEKARLAPYVTNLEGPIFALTNLAEVVKGALFARYSRSHKSLRRLLLDEFLTEDGEVQAPADAGRRRGERLFDKVFVEYGDDSVAQLGGVHLACEGASNILTKQLEWGRLAAYLDQSTRYIAYDDKPGGHYRYHTPSELQGELRSEYRTVLDDSFDTYAKWIKPIIEHLQVKFPPPDKADRAYKASIKAKALDALRGMLPAATRSNVGIYGTGQAYENLLLRLRAAEESEANLYADAMLAELQKVIPSFVKRVDRPDRGHVWSEYLKETRRATAVLAQSILPPPEHNNETEVRLVDFDPLGELKVVAAALYAVTDRSEAELLECARAMTSEQRADVLKTYVGDRKNRRHKPGRGFERTDYRFDVLGDYGAFRDLQRHRLLTLEWQPLSCRHGYVMPALAEEVGAADDFRRVMDRAASLWDKLKGEHPQVAPYVVPMAYRVRYTMQMNARAAMHVIELRSAPQGHPSYRRVVQTMHRLIDEQAGHHGIAAAMSYVNHGEVELERLEAERAADRRRQES